MLDDMIEEGQEVEGQEAGEQQTQLPDHAAGERTQSRQELIESTLAESGDSALQEAIVEELGEKPGELTIDDLRKIPGSEGMSDEELKAEWEKAVATAGGQAAQAAEAFKLPFPVYDAQGQKIDALEKISVRDLLEGKLQIGYNALGKEQRKTLVEALRNASMGHWNEQKYNTTIEERNRVHQELQTARQQIDQFANERKVWDAALTALAMGNVEPMKALAQAYQKAITSMPQAAPGMVPVDQVRAEQEQIAQGQKFINETIIPAGLDLAQRYGADAKEVIGAIESLIRRDMQFLTREKIDSILQIEIPQLLEANGYSMTGQASQQAQPSNELTELKQTVAALQERIAGQKNASTQAVREKTKRVPAVGSGAVPGAGDSMPSFKTRSQMKAWMQGDADWAKA